MFLDSKNIVFASRKCRVLLTYSLSTPYQTSSESLIFDREGGWFSPCPYFALNEVNLLSIFKFLTIHPTLLQTTLPSALELAQNDNHQCRTEDGECQDNANEQPHADGTVEVEHTENH